MAREYIVTLDENDPFKSLFSHGALPGHDCDITQMQQGGFRAECSCGWHKDVDTYPEARHVAMNHVKVWRIHLKKKR